MTDLTLTPPMASEGFPESASARWVGAIDDGALGSAKSRGTVRVIGGYGYQRARLLVRRGPLVRGFVDLALDDGVLNRAALASSIRALPEPQQRPTTAELPSFTVVICTRDRAEILATALRSVLDLDYPNFDVIVVDNASATSATRDLVLNGFADSRLTLVSEPVAGLARARNTGIANATGDFVAFTDDDVVVDAGWLSALAAGFAREDDVDCVVGLVPSGELRTRVQAYFDQRVTWAHNLVPRVFTMAEKPTDLPTFPFSVGQFGTGANFALRRSTLAAIGDFDTAFGVGTRTGGGEDIDMFSRVLLAGRTLVVEPSAIVWHRHRADLAALRVQATGYGVGLGAWLTKLVMSPDTLPLVLSRGLHGLSRLASIGRSGTEPLEGVPADSDPDWNRVVAGLGPLEVRSALKGPWRYARQRLAGERMPGSPAAPRPVPQTVPFDIRGRRITRWGATAVVAGVLGLLALIPTPVPGLQAVLVIALVLVGPGAALRNLLFLSPAATAAAVPGLGLSLMILISSGMAAASFWHPHAALAVVAILTIAVGLTRWLPAGRTETVAALRKVAAQ